VTTATLPTVEELASQHKEAGWDCVPDIIDQMFDDCLVPAMEIKEAASGMYTAAPCGYYYNPGAQRYGIYAPATPFASQVVDFVTCKKAADRVGPTEEDPLTIEQVSTGDWVKVAYSPWVNKTLQYLNFLPGKYPGGIPNIASPIASMATTGLLGAGLGYGAGWLGEKLMPEKWKRGRLRKTLAVIGGLAGAVPGAMYGAWNVAGGKPFYEATLKNVPKHPVTGNPINVPAHSFDPAQREVNEQKAFEAAGKSASAYTEANEGLVVELGSQYLAAVEKLAYDMMADQRALDGESTFLVKHAFMDTFGGAYAPRRPRGPLDINVDTLGNTLWDVGAKPGTAAMTMGALHAAQQMPGGRDESGWVTPTQMAGLAAHMGAGYVSGALVGSALGMLTGMPAGPQQTLKDTGMYLGIVKSVVPKLFGQ
jgi:hypothetical protein